MIMTMNCALEATQIKVKNRIGVHIWMNQTRKYRELWRIKCKTRMFLFVGSHCWIEQLFRFISIPKLVCSFSALIKILIIRNCSNEQAISLLLLPILFSNTSYLYVQVIEVQLKEFDCIQVNTNIQWSKFLL